MDIREMNKDKLINIWAVAILALLPSCDANIGDEMIWDIVPTTAKIIVEDAKGVDLLANGKIDISKIIITYKGQEVGVYSLEEYQKFMFAPGDARVKPAPTRALPAFPYGAWVEKDAKTERFILNVGEYASGVDIRNEEIIIDWGIGSRRDTITFNVQVQTGRNTLKITEEWFLNHKYLGGKDCKPIKIVF